MSDPDMIIAAAVSIKCLTLDNNETTLDEHQLYYDLMKTFSCHMVCGSDNQILSIDQTAILAQSYAKYLINSTHQTELGTRLNNFLKKVLEVKKEIENCDKSPSTTGEYSLSYLLRLFITLMRKKRSNEMNEFIRNENSCFMGSSDYDKALEDLFESLIRARCVIGTLSIGIYNVTVDNETIKFTVGKTSYSGIHSLIPPTFDCDIDD